MDNYFTSIALFSALRDRGYGACGTARPGKLPFLLQEFKEQGSSSKIPLHTICAIAEDNVLCFGWKDSNLVLTLSTVHSPSGVVPRARTRPAASSTNGAQFQQCFGSDTVRTMDIPSFIDDYNHSMNGVDLASLYRSSYETHRATNRNCWQCLSGFSIKQWSMPTWFSVSTARSIRRLSLRTWNSQRSYINGSFHSAIHFPAERCRDDLSHLRVQLQGRRACAWCQYRRKQDPEIKGWAGRTASGCSTCGHIPL